MQRRALIALEKGILGILTSSIFIAFFGLFVKLGMRVSSIPLLVFMRFFTPLLLLIPWIILKGGKKIFTSKTNLKDQIIRSCSVVFVQFCLFHYLSKASLLNGVMLWNTGPIFIPILSMLLFKQSVSRITWFSVIVGLIGVACIIKPDKGIFDPNSIYGILAGIGMGFSQVMYGFTANRYKTTENLFYLFGISSFLSSIVLIISIFFMHEEIMRAGRACFNAGYLNLLYIFLIAICSICSQSLRGFAYKFAKPVSLSPFLYFSVIIAGILDAIIFNRYPNFLSIIGSLLIILASFLKWSFTINARKPKT